MQDLRRGRPGAGGPNPRDGVLTRDRRAEADGGDGGLRREGRGRQPRGAFPTTCRGCRVASPFSGVVPGCRRRHPHPALSTCPPVCFPQSSSPRSWCSREVRGQGLAPRSHGSRRRPTDFRGRVSRVQTLCVPYPACSLQTLLPAEPRSSPRRRKCISGSVVESSSRGRHGRRGRPCTPILTLADPRHL